MPFFIDVFHGFYRTAIVPTFIDIVPFLINILPTNNLLLKKNLHLIIFSRLSHESVPKLNFMNHVILCFPSWDSSIPESRLCIESFLFPIYPLWSCLANEELSSDFSQPCKYFGIQRYFVWAQQTTPDKPWNPFEISTTTRNCLKLHLSWIPRHKCKFALLGKLSSHSPFLFSLGRESDLFF